MQEITGTRLLEEFRQAKASAASWDQWEPEEWAELPLEAVSWLARMLSHIEAGGRWPKQTLWGNGFFLGKGRRGLHGPDGISDFAYPTQAL